MTVDQRFVVEAELVKNRGVQDIFICCVDGLSGFPEAIEAVFPKTTVQLCIVHMVRNSLKFVPWKQRKTVAADLKTIYRAATVEEAEMNLDLFAETWDESYLPDDQPLVAGALGTDHSLLRLPR